MVIVALRISTYELLSVEQGMYQDGRPLVGILSWHLTDHPGQLGLAISPWMGAVSTDDDHEHCYEFYVTVGRVTRTSDTPAYSRRLLTELAIRPTWGRNRMLG